MAAAPQHILDLVNSLIQSYPTGLPEGIHLNINLAVSTDSTTVDINPGDPPAGPVYKGPFLGLYRVIATNQARRIKVRSDFDPAAPEMSINVDARHINFMRALNPTKPGYLEGNGYIYTTSGSNPKTYYKQYAFDGQLLVVAETRRVGSTVMGRVIGIGTDPLMSDPKPLNAAVTNNNLTPWLVHQIPGSLVFAPILASVTEEGWVIMDELEKVR